MAGLDPAIHVLRADAMKEVVDARVKPGHDEVVDADYAARILPRN